MSTPPRPFAATRRRMSDSLKVGIVANSVSSVIRHRPFVISHQPFTLPLPALILLFTICFLNFSNAAPYREWTRIWGSSSDDYGHAVSVDASGNVYVAGYTFGSFDGQTNAGRLDLCVTKYATTGTKLWSRIWGSINDEKGFGSSVDELGNVYVAGYTSGSFDGQTNAGGTDLCVTKYGADGTKLWTRLWGSAATDWGSAASVDSSGNLYVAGSTDGSFDGQTNAGGADLCVTKWGTDGTKLWTRLWGSGTYDYGHAASVDGSGNLYVAGRTTGSFDGQTNAGNDDLCVTKYGPDGTKLWTRIWGSAAADSGSAASVDSSGNVYVAGSTDGSFDGQTNAGGADLCVTKWGTDGTKLWTRLWGSTNTDMAKAVSVDGFGNVYVTGITHGSFDGQTNAGGGNFCVTKYQQDGTRLWVRLWGSTDWHYGNAASVDSSGNVYVAGSTYGSFDGQTNAGGADLCVTKWVEPLSIENVGASDITTNSATLRGLLTATGQQTNIADVTIYWGPTDGGTNAAAWSNSIFFGALAASSFTTNIYSLQPYTLYYYRCFASNASGIAWAPSSTNFTTPSGLEITTDTLPSGMEMVAYNATLQATNGMTPYAWSVAPQIVAWGNNAYGQANVPTDSTNIVAIAAGNTHSMMLRSDGTVAAWGYNGYGQTNVPTDLTNVVAIAGGQEHSLALRADGTVAAWGRNNYGQTNVSAGLSNIVAIAAGDYHNVALRADGTVTAWGWNGNGETNVPTDLTNVVAIAAGDYHNVALRTNGTVAAWGRNNYGQTNVPTDLTNVVAIACGASHSLALCADGTIITWGSNGYGEKNVPAGLSNVVAVAAGGYHNLALRTNGTVAAWGYNGSGQTNVPADLTNIVAIAVGWSHNLALRGSNTRLPDGLACSTNGVISGTPTLAGTNPVTFVVQDARGASTNKTLEIVIASNPNTRPVIDASAPQQGVASMDENDTLAFAVTAHDPDGQQLSYTWTWDGAPVGGNSSNYAHLAPWGSIGTHELRCYVSDDFWTNVYAMWQVTVRDIPLEITTDTLPSGMEMVAYNAALQATNGTPPYTWSVRPIVAWGRNVEGQINVPASLSNVVAVAAGWVHNLALKSDGTVVAWGSQTNVPTGMTDVAAIAAGEWHNLALKSDGTVVAWGDNSYGQSDVPTGLTNAAAIAGGVAHSLALKSDGTVVAWGNNQIGQINVPTGLTNVAAIAAGRNHSLALKSDGTVVAWGYNWQNATNVPSGLTNVAAIAAGWSHSLALKSDGTVAAWGYNSDGLSDVPTGLTNVAAIAAGGFHNLALRGSNTRLPEGLVCSTNGVISGTPTLAGTNLVTFVVQDALGANTNKTLEIVIAPNPNTRPVISSNSPPVGALSMSEATNRLFQVWAYDPEGSNLVYYWKLDGSPVGGDSNAWTYTTDWGDAGVYQARCYISDGLWSNIVYAQWNITVLADSDSNGLPDWWETQYFGNLGQNGQDDPDGDGLTNLQESENGTNPTAQDSDSDSFSDYVEFINQTSPTNNASYPSYPYKSWTRIWGSANRDYGWGASVDPAGNVYVAGETSSSFDGQTNAGGYDLCVTKFGPSGTKLWTRIWGDTNYDGGYGVSADSAGNVYVVGFTEGSFDGQTNAGGRDICVTKFAPDGTKLWTRLSGGTNNDYSYGASVDSDGNVYIVGETYGSFDGQTNAGGWDICVAKFDPDGMKLWTRLWGSVSADTGCGVSLDSGGNVYVAGYTSGSFDGQTNAGNDDLCVIKFDQSGTKLWTRIWGGASWDYGYGASVDSDGNVYIAGETSSSFDGQTNAGGRDLCVTKFTSDGAKLWTRIWGSEYDDSGYGASVDSAGNVYVAGYTAGSFDGQTHVGYGYNDFCVSKFDTDGAKLWTRIWGSEYDDSGWAENIDVDSAGNVYVAGYTSGSFDGQTNAGGSDLCVTKWTDEPLPPTVENLPPYNLTATSATLNGNVVSTGGAPTTVRIYYGISDTGTNAVTWANFINFGILSTGSFQTNIQFLISNTQYYYRCFASNASGIAWASETTNFTTLQETNLLVVASAYGTPMPSGTSWFVKGTLVTAGVAGSPFTVGGTQYVCMGWVGTGSAPGTGATTNTSFNITNNSTLTWNWATNYWLAVGVVGSGTCESSVGWLPAGTNVTITATPSNGYHFAGWTGDLATNANPLTLPMTRPYSVTANFAIDTFTITASAGSGGSIAPSGIVTVAYGQTTNFTITPLLHYHISDIVVDGGSMGVTNAYMFSNVTNSHTIGAYFGIDTYTLTVTTPYGTAAPAGTTTNDWNTLVNASVQGSPFTVGTTQYVCTGWTGTWSAPGTGATTNTSFNITNNSTLTWRWATNYWGEWRVTGGQGQVDKNSGWQPAGTNVTITAVPSNGYRFANWTGNVSAVNNPLTLTMSRPYSVTANFPMNTGSVTVAISPPEIVARGAQWRMTAGPDTNWHGNGYVIGNVPGSGALYTITFTNILGWTSPGDITTVDIAHGATTTLNAAYSIGDMALIPGGTFQMGIQDGAGGHTVTLDSFHMDRKEVTMGQYQAFCAATGRQMPTNLPPWWTWGDTNLPMVFVAWHEAASYAAWIGKRLPTEAEFEYAMRGGFADRRYPWGDTISSNNANYNLNVGGRALAGRYPATAYDIFDIAGNVAEWCNDWHTNVLTGPVTNPVGPASGEYKVIRGGAWPNWQNNLTCAFRSYAERYATYSSVGFRCVRTHEDLDLNNIPDLWERSYFGGTCDPQGDPDNDGLKNWQEYVADTDPTNRLSALRIKSIVSQGNEIRIEWSGGAQATQFVQRCSRFTPGTGTWQSILTNMPPMPASSNFTDTRATNTWIFYRIKAAR